MPFQQKMLFYQEMISCNKDQKIVRLSYLDNGNPYTWKDSLQVSLRNRPLRSAGSPRLWLPQLAARLNKGWHSVYLQVYWNMALQTHETAWVWEK